MGNWLILLLVACLQVVAYFVAIQWLEREDTKKLPTGKAWLATLLAYFWAC
jgi:hypothetical protein